VLGLPIEDSNWFARHVHLLSRCLMPPYGAHDEVEESAEALHHFVANTLAARRKNPRDDLLSMLATDDTDRGLAPEELIYQVMGVILGGSDTKRTGLNMAVGRLLNERAIWDEVMTDRSLTPDAIEEALRIEPPVGSMPRYTPAPVKLDAIAMPAGQLVTPSTTSALRDEKQHAEAETFDLHRKDRMRPHMVFGRGAHRCLGEMLARLELEEGLAPLMDGAPEIELVEAPRMLSVGGIRRSTPLLARIP
jgi:cytochrome P450